MGLAVVETYPPRTFLDAVKLAMQGCGYPAPGTLTGADRNTARAMEAVKVALNEIFHATQWDWRFNWWSLTMLDNQMWYEPPADFSVPGAQFGMKDRTFDVRFMSWEQLSLKWPYVRHVPAPFGNATLAAEAVQSTYQGSPYYWTIKGGYVGLWPVPNDDSIEVDGTILIGGYYATHMTVYEDGDELDIPSELYPAHEFLTSAYFKQALEWGDFKITEDRGRGLLVQAVRRHRRKYLTESQLMPEA